MGDEEGGVDAYGLTGSGGVGAVDGRGGGDEARTAKGDACGDAYLAEEVEPDIILISSNDLKNGLLFPM